MLEVDVRKSLGKVLERSEETFSFNSKKFETIDKEILIAHTRVSSPFIRPIIPVSVRNQSRRVSFESFLCPDTARSISLIT